jgi:hypothetical protein
MKRMEVKLASDTVEGLSQSMGEIRYKFGGTGWTLREAHMTRDQATGQCKATLVFTRPDDDDETDE